MPRTISRWRSNGLEAVEARRDVYPPVLLSYCLPTGPMEPELREIPLVFAVSNSPRMIHAHTQERRKSRHGNSVVRPKRVAPLGPLVTVPRVPLAALATVLRVVVTLGVLLVRVASAAMEPMGLLVVTLPPPPRAFFVLVRRRPNVLGSLAEIRATATAAILVASATGLFLDSNVAAMARVVAATGICPGAGIPPGCIYLISVLEVELTACWPRGARSAAVTLALIPLVPSGPRVHLASHATNSPLFTEPVHTRMRALGQFEGGLVLTCSRLGRGPPLAAMPTPRDGQFVGNLRCLGRALQLKKPLVRGSSRASRRGTRRFSVRSICTQSASPRGVDPTGLRRASTRLLAWQHCVRELLPALPPPAMDLSPLAATTTLPTLPPGLRRMHDTGSPVLTMGVS